MTTQKTASGRQQAAPVRRYRRRTVRIKVEYGSTSGGVRREYATTLGAGGLFIESEDPLPRGSRIKLAFSLPGRTHRHELEARVVWANCAAEPGKASQGSGMGIQFTDRISQLQLARELEDWEPPPAR